MIARLDSTNPRPPGPRPPLNHPPAWGRDQHRPGGRRPTSPEWERGTDEEMHDAQRLLDCAAQWRDHAELLRQYGAEAQATTLEQCAADVEEELQKRAEQPLTLAEAARVSGYSKDHLGRLVRDGKIPNAGRKGSPRIARQNVPQKPGAKVASTGSNREIDFKQIVRSTVNEGA